MTGLLVVVATGLPLLLIAPQVNHWLHPKVTVAILVSGPVIAIAYFVGLVDTNPRRQPLVLC